MVTMIQNGKLLLEVGMDVNQLFDAEIKETILLKQPTGHGGNSGDLNRTCMLKEH